MLPSGFPSFGRRRRYFHSRLSSRILGRRILNRSLRIPFIRRGPRVGAISPLLVPPPAPVPAAPQSTHPTGEIPVSSAETVPPRVPWLAAKILHSTSVDRSCALALPEKSASQLHAQHHEKQHGQKANSVTSGVQKATPAESPRT